MSSTRSPQYRVYVRRSRVARFVSAYGYVVAALVVLGAIQLAAAGVDLSSTPFAPLGEIAWVVPQY